LLPLTAVQGAAVKILNAWIFEISNQLIYAKKVPSTEITRESVVGSSFYKRSSG
jgi:hypothetical protein